MSKRSRHRKHRKRCPKPSVAAEACGSTQSRNSPSVDPVSCASATPQNPAMGHDDTKGSLHRDDTMAKPNQFARRYDDVYVPLIAVDNLPGFVRIEGYSKTFTLNEVERMNGEVVYDGNEGIEYSVKIQSGGPQADPPEYSTKVPSDECLHVRLPLQNGTKGKLLTLEEQDRLRANLRANNARRTHQIRQRYNPTTPGVLGEKVYCTHWIRTGECDFMQQGCMYVHCMPDLPTLELLGFRSYPRWFREMPFDYQQGHAKSFDPKGLGLNQVRRSTNTGMWRGNTPTAEPMHGHDPLTPIAIPNSPANSVQPYCPEVYNQGYAPYGIERPMSVHSSSNLSGPPTSMVEPARPMHVQRSLGPARRLARTYHYQPYLNRGLEARANSVARELNISTPTTVSPEMQQLRTNFSCRGTATSAYSPEENVTSITPSVETPAQPLLQAQMDGSGEFVEDDRFNITYKALEPTVTRGIKYNEEALDDRSSSMTIRSTSGHQQSSSTSTLGGQHEIDPDIRLYPSKFPRSEGDLSSVETHHSSEEACTNDRLVSLDA